MEKKSEYAEFSERPNRLEWIDPAQVTVDGNELHWNKISQEMVLESFHALERMRPFLGEVNLFNDQERDLCREKLFQVTDNTGKHLFEDQDLRFFDLYFGNSDRIFVDRTDDVTNGRHRLWLARKVGVKELPVMLSGKINKETFMSSLDLAHIEGEAIKEDQEAGEMQKEIEQHKERSRELQEALQKIRNASKELGSDQLREAEQRAEQAQIETDRQVEKLRERRDELLKENKEFLDKVVERNKKSKEVNEHMKQIESMFEGASDEFKSQIKGAGDSLSEELHKLEIVEKDLLDVRSALEKMDFD
jgi:hypothetical protein